MSPPTNQDRAPGLGGHSAWPARCRLRFACGCDSLPRMTQHPAPTHAADETSSADARAQAAYTRALPTIRKLAHRFHRRLYGEWLDEAVAETEAFVWKAFRDLTARGRDPVPLTAKIVDFAARRVRAGNRFAGKVSVRDALSAEARQRHGYFVTALPQAEDEAVAPDVHDGLRHRGPSPADEAICKIDYEAWLDSLSARQREVAEGLASHLNVSEVARRDGVSKASVQQVRDRLSRQWDEFHGQSKDR